MSVPRPAARHRVVLALLVGLIAVGLAAHAAHAAAPLRVGSVAESRFTSSYTFDGTNMTNARAKLLNPANFSAAGTVGRAVTITDTAAAAGSINAGLLSGFDVFFIGWLDDANGNAFTAGELSALATWVNDGGVLIVTCDDEGHDAVCASFGYPVDESAENPMRPVGDGVGHPIFNGPFGAVTEFQMSGNQGFFTATAGAAVLAQDSAATPNPVFLIKKLGKGWLILFSDVDIIADTLEPGDAITSSNEKVLGNLFAFAGNVAALRVGSVAQTRFGTDWTLNGVQMQNTRAKLLAPANFGASGTFGRAIQITDTAATPGSVDAALLGQFDVFFIGWLTDSSPNAFTAGELAAMQAWVTAGGTLIVTCDDPDHDAVCAHLGHPSTPGATNPAAPVNEGVTHPIFAGPFGSVPTLQMSGSQGQFGSAAGATVLARDSGGRAVVMLKPVGAGWVVLIGDVDILANAASGGPGITTNNDRAVGNLFAFAGAPSLRVLASVLPISRSVQVGGSPATAFATILVTGLGLAVDCRIDPITDVPGAIFGFQTTDPSTNALIGVANTGATASGGALRTFVFSFTPGAPFGPADVAFQFKCANTPPAPVIVGLDTFLFLATAGPGPDMVALAATAGSNGIVDVPNANGSGAFSVATVNLGSGGNITVQADTGSATLPVALFVCRTDPATGVCLTAVVPSLTLPVGAGETPTFAVFVAGSGDIAFDPATNRVFLRFKLGSVTVGATSVAVRTVAVP